MNSQGFKSFKSFMNSNGGNFGGSGKQAFPMIILGGLIYLASSSIYYGKIFFYNFS